MTRELNFPSYSHTRNSFLIANLRQKSVIWIDFRITLNKNQFDGHHMLKIIFFMTYIIDFCILGADTFASDLYVYIINTYKR